MKLFRLSGPLAVRFLFAICMLLLLSATADAGIFKRLKERRATTSNCTTGQCASGQQCATGSCATGCGCSAPAQSMTPCANGNCQPATLTGPNRLYNAPLGQRFTFPVK